MCFHAMLTATLCSIKRRGVMSRTLTYVRLKNPDLDAIMHFRVYLENFIERKRRQIRCAVQMEARLRGEWYAMLAHF